MKTYELKPMFQKSFYGKAYVAIENDATETLYSYNTAIIRRANDGELTRLWGGLVGNNAKAH